MVELTAAQASAAGEAIAERMTRRALLGARYDAGLARDVVSLLVDLERDLAAQIAAADMTGVSRTSARRQRLDRLLDETRAQIRASYRRVRLLAERELDALFEIEAEATRNVVRSSFSDVGVRMGVSPPASSYMAALAEETLVMGEPLSSFWRRQEANLQASFAREMRLGLQAGETIPQLVRRIRGGTRDGVHVGGIMATTRANAAALARTSAASVGNSARFAVYEANGDVIEEYVHISRLDGRTTPICVARAGKRWKASDRSPIGHKFPFQTPPLHVNCRSVLVVRVIGADVPSDQNGEQWFNGLAPADQNALFGRGRADMFRAGDITMRQLFDQSGRPISLAQLKEASA